MAVSGCGREGVSCRSHSIRVMDPLAINKKLVLVNTSRQINDGGEVAMETVHHKRPSNTIAMMSV